MPSGYRGILRYDEVIRYYPASEGGGVLLPVFPTGVPLPNLRLNETSPGVYVWVDLHDVSPLWVEYYNGGFKLHIYNIPAVGTQAVVMTPEDIRWLEYDDGTIRLKSIVERLDEARAKKYLVLHSHMRKQVDAILPIRGVYIGMDMPTALWLLDIRETYNLHLTTILALDTVEEIEAYSILPGWPSYPAENIDN